MQRPYSFNDIKGHKGLVEYLQHNLMAGSLSHFLIFEGPEGLGKTSLADIVALHLVYGDPTGEEYKKAYKEVVLKNTENSYIKRFKCSVNGGKDVALQIKDEMSTTLNLKRPKVIICDECHGLTEAAQDVFLSETEFLSDKVYVIMLTTEITKLRASLRSRAVPIHLEPLKQSEMLQLLKQEVASRNLRLQNEEATLQLIAEWAENKPRTGLNLLSAFNNSEAVAMDTVRSLIGYLDVKEVLPLLKSLSGSMTYGLSFIEEIGQTNNLISLVTECINIKAGEPSYKVKMSDIPYIRTQLEKVTIDQLIKFLYGITAQPVITKSLLVHSFIHAHSSYDSLGKSDVKATLAIENIQRAEVQAKDDAEAIAQAPTFETLLLNSEIIDD